VYLVYINLSMLEIRFVTYEDTKKTLHSTLVLIEIANHVVRYSSYGVMTLIFNKNVLY